MKGSFNILGFFVLGIIIGLKSWFPGLLLQHDPSIYALYLLIFFVGAGIGGDKNFIKILKSISFKYLLIPCTVIAGTFLGITVYLLIFPREKVLESFAVSAGFGYYSLSSILIAQFSGKVYGIIALLANISREIFTLLFTPILARYFGKISPIVCGGATSMDTTLPIIVKYSGKEYAFLAIFNGIILTILVPILISLIYSTQFIH